MLVLNLQKNLTCINPSSTPSIGGMAIESKDLLSNRCESKIFVLLSSENFSGTEMLSSVCTGASICLYNGSLCNSSTGVKGQAVHVLPPMCCLYVGPSSKFTVREGICPKFVKTQKYVRKRECILRDLHQISCLHMSQLRSEKQEFYYIASVANLV